ncbi:MAG: plastocyanin/azurin family copper-binding protein [Dehalococcoidia bacterium]
MVRTMWRYILFSALVLLAVACGTSDTYPSAATPTSTLQPTAIPRPLTTPAAVPTEAAAATPTGTTSGEVSQLITLTISTDGDKLRFDKNKLTASAGDKVLLRFNNASSALQHNWVLVKDGTKDAVAAAGSNAGPGSDWVPSGDRRVVAHTKLVDPGKSGEVRFTAPAAGTYQFVCTFPGHNAAGMFGELVVSKSSKSPSTPTAKIEA